MNGLFYKCSSLIYLPDISKWNNSNVKNIACLFAKFSSLLYLHDISKWNTLNVTNIMVFFMNTKIYLFYLIYKMDYFKNY